MSKIILSILLCLSINNFVNGQHFEYKSYLDSLSMHRAHYDDEFKDTASSPLLEEDRLVFETHNFYAPDTAFRVIATLDRNVNPMEFEMKTTTMRRPVYRRYAIARFHIDGVLYELEIYQNVKFIKKEKYKDYLFLPYSDLTCGNESYGGGRYLDLRTTNADTIVIDFNFAYNPYCAYNHRYSCPIVPAFNQLNVEISAGEKAFKKH